MFKWFTDMFNPQPALPEIAQPSEAELAEMMALANANAANGAIGDMSMISAAHLAAAPMAAPQAVNENLPSLDAQADTALTKLLASKHLHLDVAGAPKAIRWFQDAQVTAAVGKHGNHISYNMADQQTARLRIEFKKDASGRQMAFGDFTEKSVNEAIHGVLGSVPVMKGHIKPDQGPEKLYGEVGAELNAALAKHEDKVPAPDRAKIIQYFTNSEKMKFNAYSTGNYFEVNHPDGVIDLVMNPGYIVESATKSDNESSDQKLLDYMNAHKDDIKNYIVQKSIALGIEGVDAASLANLSIEVSTKKHGYSEQPTFSLGIKEGDKLTKSALAKVNTEKLRDFFVDAIIEESKPLPDILPLVANGEIIGKILKARGVANDPAIAKILSHDHFLPAEVAKAKYQAETKANMVELPRVAENGDNKHVIDYTFNLPTGVSLQDFRKSLASTLQHQVSSGISHGDASLLSA